jgi:hypothetical protein
VARSHRGSSVGRTRGVVGDWIVDRGGQVSVRTIYGIFTQASSATALVEELNARLRKVVTHQCVIDFTPRFFCARTHSVDCVVTKIWCKVLIPQAKLSHENRRPLTRRSIAVCVADFEGLLGSWEPKQRGINLRDTNEGTGTYRGKRTTAQISSPLGDSRSVQQPFLGAVHGLYRSTIRYEDDRTEPPASSWVGEITLSVLTTPEPTR